MPGITGIISKNVDAELLQKMSISLLHENWHRVDRCIGPFFGIARIHSGIFNPQTQPIFNKDRSICIFMDGMIYGYDNEIRKLKERHKFTVGNAAEYCLHSYEEYGIDFVKELNGSFVIVICVLGKKRAILLTDRYGLRPIYYTLNKNGLLFASEVKAILKNGNSKRRLREDAIADFTAFGYLLGNKTFFENIEVVPPASVLTYENQKISIKQYWDFKYCKERIKEEELVEELMKSFEKAVRLRTRDHHRYGISLSGGLDSRCIAAVIRKDAVAFTFGTQSCDDERIAACVAKKAGLSHIFINYGPDSILPYAEEVVKFTDGFNIVSTSFTPYVYRKVKQYIDVSFIGLAMDLLLGGSFLDKNIMNSKNDNDLATVLYKKKRVFNDKELNYLFNQGHLRKANDCSWNSFESTFCAINQTHPGNKSDYFYLQNHVRRFTIMGHVMVRNYVEDALPSYDKNFIDSILKIPPESRLNHQIYIKFLKKLSPKLAKIPYQKTMVRANAPLFLWKLGKIHLSLKRRFKETVLSLSGGKVSIPDKHQWVDFNGWLRLNKTWNLYTKKLLLGKDAISKEYFNGTFLKKLFQEHEDGKKNNSLKILYLVTFEIFLRLIENEI